MFNDYYKLIEDAEAEKAKSLDRHMKCCYVGKYDEADIWMNVNDALAEHIKKLKQILFDVSLIKEP